jgi:hypothetical protein
MQENVNFDDDLSPLLGIKMVCNQPYVILYGAKRYVILYGAKGIFTLSLSPSHSLSFSHTATITIYRKNVNA